MNALGAPVDSMFTSSPNSTPGTGISVVDNYAFDLFATVEPLRIADLSTNGRYYYGDITVTFNRPVSNPVIQISALGGTSVVGGLAHGHTAEFELATPGITASRLSGSAFFDVTGNTISNTAATITSSCSTGAACGSVLFTGTNITSLTFRVYVRGDSQPGPWSSPTTYSGDRFFFGGVSVAEPVTISGTVFDDTNGLTDSLINGTGTNAGGLFANLVDSSGNVVASTTVASNGIYSFQAIGAGQYTVSLSTTAGVQGNTAPAASLPAGWVNTGEGTASSGDGTVNGATPITVNSVDVSGVNFGINLQPSDYGDAPDSYGDASHTISPALYLGSAAPDSEADTQLGGDAGAGADGDDGDGTDDEDGVTFSPSLSFPDTIHVVQAGISNTVDVNASEAGILNAWIDYNQDGDFDDPGEQIFDDENLSAGNNSLSFIPDITLLHGPTYARFRFGSQTGLGPDGSATDGEVEDYEVNIASPVTDINACAVTGLVDGEFELLDIAQGSPSSVLSFGSAPTLARQYNETDVPGWNFEGTTTPTPLDDIEIWQSQHGGGQVPFDAFEGGQHAEINAEEDGALFQDVVTTPGAAMGWQFAHRGRTGNDTMEFRLGPPGATVSQGTFTSGNDVNDPNEGWKLYNGTYTVPAGQYVTRVELRAVSTATGNIRAGNFIDTVEFTLPPCIPPYDPNLLLVKRITKVNGGTTSVAGDNLAAYKQEEAYVYDDNTIEAATPPDTDKWPNTTGKASSTFLIGGTDGGRTRPGDEVEYTIYFLSTGNIDAADVQLCDKVPDFQTYVPDAFNSVPPGPSGGVGANRGMVVEYDGNTFSYTNDADGDIAQFFPPGSALPAACNGTAAQTEDNGAVVINLGNLPHAISTGSPTTSYGAIRFRATVK
ncbi:hypothetical protein I1H34_08215 [Acaryochloris marina S15]|nr:hypothetical protein I1H34_08215 [Acaryochloris marina S15]